MICKLVTCRSGYIHICVNASWMTSDKRRSLSSRAVPVYFTVCEAVCQTSLADKTPSDWQCARPACKSGLYNWAVKQLSLADAKPFLLPTTSTLHVHTVGTSPRRYMNDDTQYGGGRRRREHHHAHRSDWRARRSLQRSGLAVEERTSRDSGFGNTALPSRSRTTAYQECYCKIPSHLDGRHHPPKSQRPAHGCTQAPHKARELAFSP